MAGHARLIRLDHHGAKIALERGTLRASVIHRESTAWVVAAGPFEIMVTGTRFVSEWDAEAETLHVVMTEGSVLVSGPCLPAPQALHANEQRTFACHPIAAASAPPVETDPSVDREPTLAASETPVPSAARPEPPATTRAAPITIDAGSDAASDWSEAARRGRFHDAYAAAEAQGFARLCTTEPAESVLELGNVARLSGHFASASEAYLAIRERFPGSSAAAHAAFHLARMTQDGSGNGGAARRWLSVYLAEQPNGAWAQDALGRLMESQHRAGDPRAIETARTYVRRFPNGGHAALARSLIAE